VRAATVGSLRERMNLFWALVFPLALVVFFSLLNPGAQYRSVSLAQFLVPAFAVYGIAVACYVNMPEGVAMARDRGVLKRLRGTPVPSWAYLVGKVGSSLVLAFVIMAMMYAVGVIFLEVRLSVADLPALALVTVLTAIVFSAMGLALTAITRDARTTSVVALGTLLPLAFISEIFFIGAQLPDVVSAIGAAFPLKPLALSAFAATDPTADAAGLQWERLGVALLWAMAAGLVAWRFFRWEPAPPRAARATTAPKVPGQA
jgi:ABC-type multidrug transport system permease subunit